MKISWKFFAGFFLGLAAIIVIYYQLVLLQLGAKTETSRWAAEIIEKKITASESIHQPKLLILGGSASHFGVNAMELERLLGMPVVNGASFAGLGPGYILKTGERMLKPGDTVLLIMEYEMYLYDARGKPYVNENLSDFVFARDPEYFRNLSWTEKFQMISTVPLYRIKRGLRSRNGEEERWQDTGVYTARILNARGDQQGHFKSARPANRASATQLNGIVTSAPLEKNVSHPHLEEFCKWARSNNIRVIATYPNLARHPNYTKAKLSELSNTVKSIFDGLHVPVVGTAWEATYSPDLFFDTMYHLTLEGSMIRSADLAKQLQPYVHRN
jgi:hypothetical protein